MSNVILFNYAHAHTEIHYRIKKKKTLDNSGSRTVP